MPPSAPPSPLSSITRMNSTVRDLFIYIYDLSPLDLDILFLLIKNNNKPMSLEQVSTIIDRDKSTTFRSLQKLVGLGICTKETKGIKEGGYHHLYSAIDIKTFKMQTEKKVKELEASFHRLLRKFEENMQEIISSVYETTSNTIADATKT
jgi:predicted transcriptional regulator